MDRKEVYVKGGDKPQLEGYIGMPLTEVVKMHEGRVKVGTIDGGAFLYIGECSDLIDKLTLLDIEYEEKYETAVDRQWKGYRWMLGKPGADATAYIKSLTRGCDEEELLNIEPTIDGYLEFIDKRFKEIREKPDKVRTAIRRRDERVSLYHRKVVDAYPSIDAEEGEGTAILLIEGNESGEYWTTNEYEEGMRRKAKEEKEDAEDDNGNSEC